MNEAQKKQPKTERKANQNLYRLHNEVQQTSWAARIACCIYCFGFSDFLPIINRKYESHY